MSCVLLKHISPWAHRGFESQSAPPICEMQKLVHAFIHTFMEECTQSQTHYSNTVFKGPAAKM